MSTRHQLESAYFNGLRSMGDIDPAVAEDLGYVTTSERFDEVVTSGQAAGALQAEPSPRQIARAEAHEYYAEEFGQRDWSNLSDEQKAINQAGFSAVRAALAEAQAKRVK